MKKIGIIGAGPSGLALGIFLDTPCEILEKTNHVGGHAASFCESGFTFDYGPHIAFSREPQLLNFIVSSLSENVQVCRRNNKIAYRDVLLKYPFENDLKSLPIEDNYACLSSFILNPYRNLGREPENMREWFLFHFGKGICDRYLFPYNEKVWNIPVDQLAMSLADRIPKPPAEDIIKSAIGYETEGYLHQLYYHYPKQGGYQAISEAWAKVNDLQYGVDVCRIEPKGDKGFYVWDDQGRCYRYERLVSTMPIQHCIKALACDIPPEVVDAVDKLRVNPMIIISLGIRGEDKKKYTAIYFPEPEFLVNRVSFPGTFSPYNCPFGSYSIQAEITYAAGAAVSTWSDEKILCHVLNGLKEKGLIENQEQVIYKKIDRIEQSYVVYDIHYEKQVQIIREWCASLNLHLLGRFSYFEYINVDGAISRALELAARLNGDSLHDKTVGERYLEKGLQKILNQKEKLSELG